MVATERSEVQARKFYSQRNMYLCGFTLFLSLILNRTYVLILDVLRLEEKVRRMEGDPAVKGRETELAKTGDVGEVGKLKAELARKEKDLQTMKAQAEGLQREYSSLADKYGETQKDPTPKKDI
jgi:B-cell receptor-associated protein 31